MTDLLFTILVVALVVFVHRFARSIGAGHWVSALLVAWLAFLAGMSSAGIFSDFYRIPPPFMIALALPMLALIIMVSRRGIRERITSVSPARLVRFQSMRIIVEICLFLLAFAGRLPYLMTPEGRNFDVLIGITAFFAVGWVMNPKRRGLAITWNLVGIGLLINVVVHGVLAAPTPFQVRCHLDRS